MSFNFYIISIMLLDLIFYTDEKALMTIKQLTYSLPDPGTHLVVLGAVHGDEKCGTKAINSVIHQIEAGEIKLKKGSVTFVPICNPKAYQEHKRFCDRNLNRKLYPKDKPEEYEDYLANVLCKILDRADVLLDLHSYHSPGEAFCFLGTSSQKELEFCRSLGIQRFVYGWADAFGKDASNDPKHSMGTTEYVRSKGGIASTVECGQHENPHNVQIGINAILNALKFCDISEQAPAPSDPQEQLCIKMRSAVIKKKSGSFIKPWQHMDQVKKGELIAKYDDGQEVFAPESGAIILPKESSILHSEWFYFGIKTSFPQAD